MKGKTKLRMRINEEQNYYFNGYAHNGFITANVKTGL
jgi:hypothetical protein